MLEGTVAVKFLISDADGVGEVTRTETRDTTRFKGVGWLAVRGVQVPSRPISIEYDQLVPRTPGSSYDESRGHARWEATRASTWRAG